MASTSSSTYVPSRSRYDVFLSFRGKDTRYSFTDHLYAALVRAGLDTFRDNDEIDRGQELKPEIERAIRESRASIIVLSENYANSRWCLDELMLILDQRRNFSHFVLPVFYHVDPSDVRNQRNSFAIEADEGVEGSKWREVKVNRWKAALTEVSNFTGMVLEGSETEFITKVIEIIDNKLDLKIVSTPAHLFGMETRAEVIKSWLKDEQSGGNVLAVCGMGGSGKTTLAQYIYNSNKQTFESSSFVDEIGKHYKQPYGLIRLQKQILRDVLGRKNITISSVSEGTHKIENALQMKNVLIVLDDVDEDDELAALIGTMAFHTQSKIIITTRLLDINASFESISRICHVYKLELMNDHESLELISFHAFGSKTPMEGFKDLAVKLAHYCGGNPLALKVLGSSLRKQNSTESWESRLNSLNSLKGDVHSKIQGVLRRSFDSLALNTDKELFLHIACFFVDQHMDNVVMILENDWYAKSGIKTLINSCLLTVSPTNIVTMHQLLQDMGRKIVCEESKNPAERSRIWCSDEAFHVLREGEGSKKIEGLSLYIPKLKRGTKQLVFKTGSLAKMKNLKLLQLQCVELVGSYNNFPELRWLCWRSCHLKTIPPGLLMSSLVVIDMSNGELEIFEPPVVLNSVKSLCLEESFKLASIRSLNRIPKLEALILRHCTSLIHLCKTIRDLESLNLLDLSGCEKLWKASTSKNYLNKLVNALHTSPGIPKQPRYSLPHSLKFLLLDYCDVQGYNDFRVVFHPQSFFHMSLAGNEFIYLPNNIDLNLIRVLDLSRCLNLKSILCIPSTLEELYTHWCTSLERITFESGRFSLRKFGYEGCLKLCEVQGLFKLVSIAKLDETDLGHMKWIKAYQDHKVDLVGDEITNGRVWKIQMVYEYGLRSTFLPGIEDQNITSEYTSLSRFLSFHVPLSPKKRRIQGLNLTILYRSSDEVEDEDRWVLFVKISNTTKGLTWVYNPMVYCKPRVDEDVVWLSYWPIGNILDVGDEVYVEITWFNNILIVNGCGATLVYMDGEIEEEEENGEVYTEEVIEGDLSEFEVNTGGYYLCRRDFLGSATSDCLKKLFDDNINYKESQGWRKSHWSTQFEGIGQLNNMRDQPSRIKVVLGVSFNSESDLDKTGKAVSGIDDAESVYIDRSLGILAITGFVDPMIVETRVREFEKLVTILNIYYEDWIR